MDAETRTRLAAAKCHECGCWDEDYRHHAFTFAGAKTMGPRDEFIDDLCWTLRHHCEAHWKERHPFG